MNGLKGRYAVVTGAGKGIGRAVVERFLAEGLTGIALLDYDEATLNQTVAELGGESAGLLGAVCDVADPDGVKAAFDAVLRRFPQVDILVNNAGITRDAMLHKMTLEQWDKVMDVNLRGVFSCISQVVSVMREKGYGRIVNISSTSAFGNVGQGNYSATKAGLLGLTATAARELGKKNITVNAIAPGFIDTDILKTVPQSVLDGYIKALPLGRLGQPEEVASVVAFLSSADSSFVTGTCLLCCGGAITSF